MSFESESQKRAIQRWSRLAIQLVGAADSARFEHITTAVIVRELQGGNVFEFLTRELPASVWEISKHTDQAVTLTNRPCDPAVEVFLFVADTRRCRGTTDTKIDPTAQSA